MPIITYPQELSKAYWDKKKGALPAGSALENQLKALQKKHDAVDWDAFEPGWEAKAKSASELDEALSQLDKLYRSKVFPLKLEAGGAQDEAQKLAKDKSAGKPTQDAIRAIVDAVKAYSKAVESGQDQLSVAHAKASAALKKTSSSSSSDDGADEDGSALLDPKRLLTQLQQCKRDPERRAHFAFLSDGKTEPVLCLSPRTTGKMLFAKLQAETGIKTGAFGLTWVDGTTMYLRMDKPMGGLVKRIRAPLKAVGFKVAKVILAGEDGSVIEEDAEDDQAIEQETEDTTAPTTSSTNTSTAPAANKQAAIDRLRALQPRIVAALKNPQADATKLRAVLAFVQEKVQGGDFTAAIKGMEQLDKLLAAAGGSTQPEGSKPDTPPAPSKAPTVVFTQIRLAWDQTRKDMQSKLQTLEKALLAACANEPDFNEIAANTRVLYGVLDHLDERLIDKLDEALNAGSEPERKALHLQAREIVSEYLDYVAADELLRDLDDNGFVEIGLIDTLNKRLQTMDKALRAA